MNKKMTFAFFILAVFSVLLPTQFNAEAAPKLVVNVQTGFENIKKTGKALPITVELKNNGSVFKGDVVVNAAFDVSGGSAVAKNIILKQGETKKVHLLLDKYYESNQTTTVRIFEGGWKKGKQLTYTGKGVIPKPKFDEGQLAIVSVGLPESSQNKVLGVLKNDEQIVYKNSNDFKVPNDALEMDAISMLIIHDNTMSKWTTDQQKIILQWMNRGGTLLVDSNVDLPRPFQEKAAINLGTNTNLLTTEIANQYFNEKKIDLKINLATLNENGMITMGNAEEIMIAKKKIGDGALVQTTFSLTEENLTNSKNSKIIVDKLIDQIEQKEDNLYGDVYTQLIDGTKIFPSFHVSSILFICILLAYILIISPLLYFVLKKKDKREYAWWIIPIGALLTAIILFSISAKGRLTTSKVQQSSIINIGESTTDIYFGQSILSNKAGDLAITGPEDMFLTRYYADNTTENFLKSSVLEQGEDENTINLLNTRYWGVTSILGKYQDATFKKIPIDIHITNGKLVGTVKNNLDKKIVDASIWSGYKKISIGDIQAGETIKLNQKITQKYLSTAKSLEDYSEEKPTDMKELAAYQKQTVENSAIATIIKPQTPLFIGWIDKSVVPLKYKDLKVQESSNNLLVQGFEEDIQLEDNFTIQDQNFNLEISDLLVDGEGYADITDDQTGWVVDEGAYKLNYTLGSNFPVSDMKWQELQIRFTKQNKTTLLIYNQKTATYEKLNDKQTIIKKDIDQYISSNGEIIMKIVRGSIDDPTMKQPMIQLKGALK